MVVIRHSTLTGETPPLEDCRKRYVVDVASPMNHRAHVLGRQVRIYRYLSIE